MVFAVEVSVCYNFFMIDLNFLRDNLEFVVERSFNKNVKIDLDLIRNTDKKRRKLITSLEGLRSEKKQIAKKIGFLKREDGDTKDLESSSKLLSEEILKIETELKSTEEEFMTLILNIPNIHNDSVPIGKDEKDNEILREWGEKPEFDFPVKPHWELGEINNFLDLPRAAKITGARFSLMTGSLAKLERVLINFMLETHTREGGYTEVVPPFIANETSLVSTGNLPKFKDDLFKLEGYDYYLIPTAEVPLTNIHRDETLKESELPKKYVAYTPCFRSEAGSHGRDVRGIIRQHQFNKIELMKFSNPDDSYSELEKLTADAEKILKKLGLHYRVVLLCTGDLSFSSAKTYDIEVWMPSRGKFVEISSCSNFEDFQARRGKIKFFSREGKRRFLHTLNGSGLAVGRTVAAIMENYQTEDGRIKVPEILKEYFDRDYL